MAVPEKAATDSPAGAPARERVRRPFRVLSWAYCVLMAVATYAFATIILPDLSTWETGLLVVLVLPLVGFTTYVFGYAAVTGNRARTWFTSRGPRPDGGQG